ncbi:uncharacterized protein LOC143199792 isoform X1 [Rhynchophorus ferrugineus]|uniref:uncharacterized protein LOC143199792 isoform X1 n=1 Tax=Rhynchophorus ferrugineus TaxID=354439 RepID=UPI003FCE83F7
MNRAYPKKEKRDWYRNERGTYCVGNLDLVNLRLNVPPDSPRLRPTEKGSGDTYVSHSLVRKYQPYTKNCPRTSQEASRKPDHRPSSRCRPVHQDRSEEVIVLRSKDSERRIQEGETVKEGDFLYPTKKKQSSRTAGFDSGCRFPFKITPSGNLKVESSQVVFSSKKLSVLVADPKNTKIDISADSTPSDSPREMAHQDGTPVKRPFLNPLEIMNQAGGLSSLGSLIGHSPMRGPMKESSEYESKKTEDILDPELNLHRLGYSTNDIINWDKVKLPEKQNLYLALYQRITNNTNADCKVYIDNEEFNCHLIVLQCYSELFDAYVAVKKVELPSDKCSMAAFGFIYDWMITGEPSYSKLSRENVLDVFISAKYLKIKDLVEQCWAFIDSVEVFNESTAFLLYLEAKKRNMPEVKELMLPRIKQFFLMLVSSQDWLELDVDDVRSFLNSNYISINCEMEVFMAAVRWLKYDWQNRDKYKYEVLECVRFGNVAPWQLVDIKRNPDNPEFVELAKDMRICKMIDDGLAFVIIKYWYGSDAPDDLRNWNSILGLQEPPTRNWTGSDRSYLTFREFLIFLDQYRRNQLIDKNKPKPGDKQRGAASSEKFTSQKSTPRVPTMDEFLAKRKPGTHKKINKVIS